LITFSDRVRGCIVGGVVGLSDDSQLTLATCEAITQAKRVSPEQIADHFLQWYRARRITGVGASTLKALRDLDAGQHWALAGAKGEMTAETERR